MTDHPVGLREAADFVAYLLDRKVTMGVVHVPVEAARVLVDAARAISPAPEGGDLAALAFLDGLRSARGDEVDHDWAVRMWGRRVRDVTPPDAEDRAVAARMVAEHGM